MYSDVYHWGYDIDVTKDFYLLNAKLSKIHPAYQIVFDEMLEKSELSFYMFLFKNGGDENIATIQALPKKNKNYWLGGKAFEFDLKFSELLFIEEE